MYTTRRTLQTFFIVVTGTLVQHVLQQLLQASAEAGIAKTAVATKANKTLRISNLPIEDTAECDCNYGIAPTTTQGFDFKQFETEGKEP